MKHIKCARHREIYIKQRHLISPASHMLVFLMKAEIQREGEKQGRGKEGGGGGVHLSPALSVLNMPAIKHCWHMVREGRGSNVSINCQGKVMVVNKEKVNPRIRLVGVGIMSIIFRPWVHNPPNINKLGVKQVFAHERQSFMGDAVSPQ